MNYYLLLIVYKKCNISIKMNLNNYKNEYLLPFTCSMRITQMFHSNGKKTG